MSHPASARHVTGFTLIELAVVIAIIGIIAGGLVGGQSLIRASRVNRVLADATTYRTALQLFNDKYAFLPGDFPTAVQVWGRADGGVDLTANCADIYNTASVGKTTCNGNGNGLLDGGENFRAWQQLAAAGMIRGQYTGIATNAGVKTAGSYGTIPEVNAPEGPLDGSAFWLWNWNIQTTDAILFRGDYTNAMSFGGMTVDNFATTGILRGREAYQLDNKADDGKPATGSIRTAIAGCVTTAVATTALYVRDTNSTCILRFLQGYSASKQAK